jgi:ubiquinone/menaquinone biosynthesis C-methylase UbiE
MDSQPQLHSTQGYYDRGHDILEAGCGTGLLLAEAARVGRSAIGLDLSRGMLSRARERGLTVVQGSLTHIPLPDASVDLVYSMKVLAHVPPIRQAVAELARVTRPGGHLLLEFYNPRSLRYLAKLLGGAAPIAEGTTDRDVYTRYDTIGSARSYLPADVEFIGMRGVRVVTPSSHVFRVPGLAGVMERAERLACDLPVLRNFGGFLIVIGRKRMP